MDAGGIENVPRDVYITGRTTYPPQYKRKSNEDTL